MSEPIAASAQSAGRPKVVVVMPAYNAARTLRMTYMELPRDTVDMDVRPGGHQRLVMVSDADPEQRAPVDATFTEVIEHELLIGEERVDGLPGFPDGAVLRMRLEFHDAGEGRTRLVVRQGPYSPDFLPMVAMGWESSFTKLDALLAA